MWLWKTTSTNEGAVAWCSSSKVKHQYAHADVGRMVFDKMSWGTSSRATYRPSSNNMHILTSLCESSTPAFSCRPAVPSLYWVRKAVRRLGLWWWAAVVGVVRLGHCQRRGPVLGPGDVREGPPSIDACWAGYALAFWGPMCWPCLRR
ncbi:hypothetical protein BRADI_2g17881v3 [Brachypodium distachyon]|uniref:Uncharacterized protein n=1 Tax=Brachypodium distachyon TaxID=15368 RepID=A0A2K2D922_BRADI|nr:hypothetical protein BRADI_2g17881v3 [Brachypodium distachyon]